MKKKRLSLIALSTIFCAGILTSCGGEKPKEETTSEATTVEATVEEEPVAEAATEVEELPGKALFKSSGCVACHEPDRKVVGPALKTIAEAYADNQDGIVLFLKEEADAIVDPTQFAVMQANLAVTKTMSDEDLNAIAAYIISTK